MDESGVLVMTGASSTVGTCLLSHLAPSWPGKLLTLGRTRPARLRSGDHFEEADLSDSAVTDLACKRIAAGPPVGALVCTAGLDSRAGLFDFNPAGFNQCVQVNCVAHLQLLRATILSRSAAPAVPLPVVVISSDVVGQQTPGTLVYAAAKAAAEEAFRHAAADLPPPGVALLLVRLPDIGVPMRTTAPGSPPPPRTPHGRPLPILDTAVQAITEFLSTTRPRAITVIWHA